MKALVMTGYGDLSANLQLCDVPCPIVDDNSVLVQVHAAALNPIDYKIVEGVLRRVQKFSFPTLMGFDGCGVVMEAGRNVDQFGVGDAVYFRTPRDRMGSFAEFLVIDASCIAGKPNSISKLKAAAFPLVALTTVQALKVWGQMKAGQQVLIHAGSGGVGSFAIQYAKTLDVEVTATASQVNAGWVSELGADTVIAYDREDYLENSARYDVVYDTLGGTTTEQSFQVLKPGGIVVSVAGPPDREFARRHNLGLVAQAGIYWMTRGIYSAAAEVNGTYVRFLTESSGEQLGEVADLVDADRIKPIIDSIYPLDEIKVALAKLSEGHCRGKVIIDVVGAAS